MATADKLRTNMDAAEYKHVLLGLIFLNYIADTFRARRTELRLVDPQDEYLLGMFASAEGKRGSKKAFRPIPALVPLAQVLAAFEAEALAA